MKTMQILMFSILFGCKFNLSPYVSETPRLLLNSVNIVRIKQDESSAGVAFRIALIADVHNYYDELDELIKYINSRDYRFVIVAGDISNLGLLSEYDEARRYFNKLLVPYLVVPGNHDLLSNGDQIFSRMFGEKNFSFSYQDIRFVIFNNNNWEAGGTVPDINWVRDQLIQSSETFKVLVAHVPPNDSDRFTALNILDWESLLSTYGVDYFLNGHNHNSSESTFGSATQVTIGSPSKNTFLELNFSNGGLTHQKISF